MNYKFEVSTFSEENLDDDSGYHSIEGKFLIISGVKRNTLVRRL